MSRTDEILGAWRIAAESATPPSVAARPAVTRSLIPVGTLAVAAVLVVVVVTAASGRLLGNAAATLAPSPVTLSVTIQLAPGHSLAVTIRDGSGSLVSARAATEAELGATPGGPPSSITAFHASGSARSELTLAWAGGLCDTTAEVDVAADLRSIAVAPGPGGQPCDSAYVGRGLVLTFNAPIDAGTVVVALLPVPSASPAIAASPTASPSQAATVSAAETPTASDVAAARGVAKGYTDDLIAGRYASAWAMLGPEYQAMQTFAEYSSERRAYFESVKGRYVVTPQPTDVAPIADWVSGTNGASIDLRHAVLVEVSYPALAGNNAGFDLYIVAPTPEGLRLYPVR